VEERNKVTDNQAAQIQEETIRQTKSQVSVFKVKKITLCWVGATTIGMLNFSSLKVIFPSSLNLVN
jgi:hypothetical protein